MSLFSQEKKEIKLENYFGDLSARQIGPAVMSGRISDMENHPTDPMIIYAGSAGGGVWKSNDAGTTFYPIFDDNAQSIGAVELDPNDPDNTIYVGTGEPWPRNSVSVGDGLYKSTDGGNNWKKIGLENSERIANIIIPPNEFGNINDAGVVEMIEFIAKDWSTPAHNNYGENVLRKGLIVLDNLFKNKFDTKLTDCSDDQIKLIFDIISYNDGIAEDLKEEASFFATYRYMVVTGWFTSEVGMRDLGYKGNIPNVWDGVPEDVLKDHDVSYDEEWIAKCVDQSRRNETAVWDKDGNLLT